MEPTKAEFTEAECGGTVSMKETVRQMSIKGYKVSVRMNKS